MNRSTAATLCGGVSPDIRRRATTQSPNGSIVGKASATFPRGTDARSANSTSHEGLPTPTRVAVLEVHRHEGGQMIPQEGAPRLRRRSTPSPDESRHGPLRHLNAECRQFFVNSRRSTQRIRGSHLVHQWANGRIGPRSALAAPCERLAQRQRSHSRCQRATVSGCTTIKALRQSGHDLASRIHRSRSCLRMCARVVPVNVASC
jgi:hypothetical protein